MRMHLEGDVERFRVPPSEPGLRVKAAWGDLSRGFAGEKIFDSGGVWQLFAAENAYQFCCSAPNLGKIPYQTARLNPEFTTAEVILHRPFFDTSQSVYPLQYPLDEVLILNLLSRKRGVEVHACGVIDESGDGLLFTGKSGAGKTTMARFWEKERGALILSDDRIILRQDKGKIWMYGTPWHGDAKLAYPSRAPLKAVFILRHGPENRLRAKTGAEAAALLFSRSFPVFYSPEGLQYTLEFYDRLTASVPCFEFDAVPNPEVVAFIRARTSAL